MGLFSGGVSAAATLSIVAVVVYGARLTIRGDMTTGTLTAFILYSLTGMSYTNLQDKSRGLRDLRVIYYVIDCCIELYSNMTFITASMLWISLICYAFMIHMYQLSQ